MEPMILDWDGAGYDAFRGPHEAGKKVQPRNEWELLDAVMAQARAGHFQQISMLPATCLQTQDRWFHATAYEIIGDGGDAATLETLLGILETGDFDDGLHAAQALVMRGRLVDAPAVFTFYELNRDRKDSSIIPTWLNYWLCRLDETFLEVDPFPDPDPSWSDYRKQVGQRYFQLWNELGTNLVHVHRGQIFNIERIVKEMLAELKERRLSQRDRHVFEATTGISCSKWYGKDGQVNWLRVAADLEGFLQSSRAAMCEPGQRSFLGYPLQHVGAAAQVLASYPQNHGLDVPFVRTAFEVDSDFALELGFLWKTDGYFYETPKIPPTATLSESSTMPWLALHVCVRQARRGNRAPLHFLARMMKPGLDGILGLAMAELLADGADGPDIADWRDTLKSERDEDFAMALCIGLLQRGMLRNIPPVLDAYRRIRHHRDAKYLQRLTNQLLAFEPVCESFDLQEDVDGFCDKIMKQVRELRAQLGRDDVPVFRGQLFSLESVAREIIARSRGPSLIDLRHLFERSTGIDCRHWLRRDAQTHRMLDEAAAAKTASAFLSSPEAQKYMPGQLYFFGQAVKH